MIRDLHEKLISGETTSVKLTEEYFEKIEKNEPDIQAYLTLTKELAMEQANFVDEKIKRGEEVDLLSGIPCAVKDNMCMKGVRTTCASKILDNYIAPYDATAIQKIKEKGAVILGKTNMDEFAMGSSTENSAYQRTKNPIDLSRVPGGSSGGSAAAVAGNEAVWALGSDTGGSIRQPASFCGIVGLKPTYGRVSRNGLIAMASSLDQIGPLTKTVEDSAIILSRLIGNEDEKDATTAESFGKCFEDYLTGDISNLKIGIPNECLEKEGLDENIREKIEMAIEKFKSLGAKIEKISLPNSEYALPTYYIIMPAEVSSNLARFDGIKYGMRINDELNSNVDANDLPRTLLETYLDTRKYGLGAEPKRRVMLGTYALSAGYYDAYYLKAQKVRSLIKKDFEEAYKKVDLIFSPTTPEVAFKFGEKTEDPLKMYLGDIFTITANLAGVPAISFPVGQIGIDEKKIPVGGQLMGKWFDEENVLKAADAFEKKIKNVYKNMELGILPEQLTKILTAFNNSYFFGAIRLILAIYVAVIIADIVMILMLKGLTSSIRTGIAGANIPIISVKKMRKRWDKIESRLETGNVSQYKVAVIEADKIIDEILKGIGYQGENMAERIGNILPGHLNDIEKLSEAHEIRNQIIHDESFELDRKKAKEVLEVYANILKNLEYL